MRLIGSISNFWIASALIVNGFSSTLQAKAHYEIEVGDKTISGTRTIEGRTEKFSFQTEEKGGLILISHRLIAARLDDKKAMDRHPFSYADATPTKVSVTIPKNYFLFSSFRDKNGTLAERHASQFVVGVANNDLWDKNKFEFMGTTFELVTPKKNAHIEPRHWQSSTKLVWKAFIDRFGTPTDHLVFVDLEGPISGGPLGENVLALFATDKMTDEFQNDMKVNLGWEPKASTKAYVEAYYPKSANQWEEYLLGTFAHEIGHLFFGFGLTREKVSNADELWFSLGLGMLYDMEITKHLTGRYPQLEVDIIESWKKNYAKLKNIDQRLINPDRSNDSKHAFSRTKVFAHGKATYFLSKLREKIGHKPFDDAVKKYLSECQRCIGGYQDFKTFLANYRDQISELEKQYQVL